MKSIFIIILQVTLFMTLSLTNFSLRATMYKWLDENGNTVFSETLPTGDIEYEVIRPLPKVRSEQALKALRDAKIKALKLRNERLSKMKERHKTREELAWQKENCERANAKLASLERPRAKILQPDGSRIRLDEDERQNQIKQAQGKIQEWCDQ